MTQNQESKMRDRFGAPLHIGDRVLHLSAVSSTPHVKTGTIRAWSQWGGKISVKIALDNGRELEARSENLLIRWCE